MFLSTNILLSLTIYYVGIIHEKIFQSKSNDLYLSRTYKLKRSKASQLLIIDNYQDKLSSPSCNQHNI